MREDMAKKLADALGASATAEPDRAPGIKGAWRVCYRREPGRYSRTPIEARVSDRGGYLVLGPADGHQTRGAAEEWPAWDGGREWAEGLASLLGGEAFSLARTRDPDAPAGEYVVVVRRPGPTGQGVEWLVAIGPESAKVYPGPLGFDDLTADVIARAEHFKWGPPEAPTDPVAGALARFLAGAERAERRLAEHVAGFAVGAAHSDRSGFAGAVSELARAVGAADAYRHASTLLGADPRLSDFLRVVERAPERLAELAQEPDGRSGREGAGVAREIERAERAGEATAWLACRAAAMALATLAAEAMPDGPAS